MSEELSTPKGIMHTITGYQSTSYVFTVVLTQCQSHTNQTPTEYLLKRDFTGVDRNSNKN